MCLRGAVQVFVWTCLSLSQKICGSGMAGCVASGSCAFYNILVRVSLTSLQTARPFPKVIVPSRASTTARKRPKCSGSSPTSGVGSLFSFTVLVSAQRSLAVVLICLRDSNRELSVWAHRPVAYLLFEASIPIVCQIKKNCLSYY